MKLLLLFVPCALALWVPFFNAESPALFGVPFFYLTAVAANLVVAAFLSLALRSTAPDETSPEDYDDRAFG